MKLPVSVVILTFNEEKNIEYCLESVYGWVDEIFIVDSYSTDKTIEVSKRYTDKIYRNPFKTQDQQFNWALDNLPLNSNWILRLDADERVTYELRKELNRKLSGIDEKVAGFYIKRQVYFMGRWMKHGGYYPTWLLRMFRKGKARCEQKGMDEHIALLEGETERLDNDIIDENHKGLSFWIDKHNKFASREMTEMIDLNGSKKASEIKPDLLGDPVERKRWLKENLYLKFPPFIRPFLYFIYRYLFLFGFLDGKEGLIFHFLQGFWYRFLVDAKIFEYKKSSSGD